MQAKQGDFMKKSKAITSYTKYSDAIFAELAQTIITKMNKNPDFPTPMPPIATIQAGLKAFNDAIAKSNVGNKQDTANKNAKRAELELNLANLGNFVNAIANGNISILDGSGFPISKQPEAIGILPPPAFIHVTDGENHGEFNVEISPVPKASGYNVLIAEFPAPEDDSKWQVKTFSKSKGTIIGLARGKKYVLKAAATSAEANKLVSSQ